MYAIYKPLLGVIHNGTNIEKQMKIESLQLDARMNYYKIANVNPY